jgi:hypothetical protein
VSILLTRSPFCGPADGSQLHARTRESIPATRGSRGAAGGPPLHPRVARRAGRCFPPGGLPAGSGSAPPQNAGGAGSSRVGTELRQEVGVAAVAPTNPGKLNGYLLPLRGSGVRKLVSSRENVSSRRIERAPCALQQERLRAAVQPRRNADSRATRTRPNGRHEYPAEPARHSSCHSG